MWSPILNRHIEINVTTTALRQMDRVGERTPPPPPPPVRRLVSRAPPRQALPPPSAPRARFFAGGIDNYLLQTSDERLDSDAGLRLRRLLLQTLKRDAARAARAAAAPAPTVDGEATAAPQPPPAPLR